MKIVIDIPDYNLDEVQNGSLACGMILKAVKSGKVLPKGHGDLIDRDVAYEELGDIGYGDDLLRFVPTVIKADK